MSEEKKAIELTEEDLEKVSGGGREHSYLPITVEAGYYRDPSSSILYLYIPENKTGGSDEEYEAQQVIRRSSKGPLELRGQFCFIPLGELKKNYTKDNFTTLDPKSYNATFAD